MDATNISPGKMVQLLLVGCAMVIVVVGGMLLDQSVVDAQLIIVLGGGVVVLGLLFNGDRARWALLCVAFATLLFGHRGIYLGRWTFVVPLEVVGWLLFVVLLMNRVSNRAMVKVHIPAMLGLLAVWIGLAAIAIVLDGGDMDAAAAWTLPIIFGVPAFVAVCGLVRHEADVERLLTIIVIVTAAISALGLIEYVFPSEVTRLAPWFFVNKTLSTQDGFVRAVFGFWGYPAVGSIIAWGSYISFQNIVTWNSRLKWANLIALALTLIGIYISGERAAWLSLGLGFILIAISLRAYGWLAVGAMYFAVGFLPAEFWNRFQTITNVVIRGESADTSLLSRLDRWQWGIQTTLDYPLTGSGFGHWLVHNEILEISSTVGIIPGIIFAIFVAALVIRIVKFALRAPTPRARQLGWLFTAIVVNWVVHISVEPDMHNPAFASPYWVLMAVAWYLPDMYSRLAQPVEKFKAYASQRLSAANDAAFDKSHA